AMELPVGPHPCWELEDNAQDFDEPRELRSIPDSLIVLQSLKQSRNKWLTSLLPKFSAKARGGKPPDVVPPPHTIKAHGRYDMKIGPHVFSNTAFYEVHYLPQEPGVPASYGQSGAPMSTAMTQSAYSQSPSSSNSSAMNAIVTPDMVSEVNAAALSNPTLNNLLQLAASGRATAEQLRTLGLLVQSLGQRQQHEYMKDDTSTLPRSHHSPRPIRPFDIVVEFQEKPSDRWIISRGPAVCKRELRSDRRSSDILLNVTAPFPGSLLYQLHHARMTGQDNAPLADIPFQIVTMRLSRATHALWDAFSTWAGGEQGMKKSRSELLRMAKKVPPRSYLQYQLPDGPLLQQIHDSVVFPYATKSIMPNNADSSRPRRRATIRKSVNPLAVPGGIVSSKQQQKQKAPSSTTPIACHACKQTDVPLMVGGSKSTLSHEPRRLPDFTVL
ncbi:uncharacterized protein LAESUDRAFT_661897, partial [Laetiporus sulphureus 93-53]